MFAWFTFVLLVLVVVWLVRMPRLNTGERAAYISLAAFGLAFALMALIGVFHG